MKPNEPLGRRDFVKQASATGLGAVVASHGIGPLFAFDGSPAEKMAVGIMGLNGRGMVHARDFAHGANTTVAYLCDVDSTVRHVQDLGDRVDFAAAGECAERSRRLSSNARR